MQKRALLGKIIVLIVVLILLASAGYYFKLKKGNVEFHSPESVISVDYNITKTQQQNPEEEISIIEEIPQNQTNANSPINKTNLTE